MRFWPDCLGQDLHRGSVGCRRLCLMDYLDLICFFYFAPRPAAACSLRDLEREPNRMLCRVPTKWQMLPKLRALCGNPAL
jgi:hypothetical protein